MGPELEPKINNFGSATLMISHVIAGLGQSQATVENLQHSLAGAEAEAADSKQALRDIEKSLGMFFLSQVGPGTESKSFSFL